MSLSIPQRILPHYDEENHKVININLANEEIRHTLIASERHSK